MRVKMQRCCCAGGFEFYSSSSVRFDPGGPSRPSALAFAAATGGAVTEHAGAAGADSSAIRAAATAGRQLMHGNRKPSQYVLCSR